jgi:sugar O-acyltransferase (sialic acid O-acetyltransferase NeuD family)
MIKLAIIGGGDLGQQIAHIAKTTKLFEVVGFFDDYAAKGSLKYGYMVLGPLSEIHEQFEKGIFHELMIGIGYKHMDVRAKLFNELSPSIPFAKIIHPSCYVDETAKVGQGSILYPRVALDMNAVVGDNVVLNIGCSIAHDSSVGNHCFFSPNVCLAGFINIQEKVNLGIGTIVIDNINISPNIKTGAGAVVTENLAEPGLYVGIPAKFKKHL